MCGKYTEQAAISIHAPREGGDHEGACDGCKWRDFNPRPPRGGRLCLYIVIPRDIAFQSTPPARGATWCFI